MKMPEPTGIAIFCDDIREEVGGKTSYMGVYNGEMIIPTEAPTVLPKFCVSVHVRLTEKAGTGKLHVTLLKDDAGKVTEMTSMVGDLEQQELPEGYLSEAVFNFVTAGFRIDGDCKIGVRVSVDESSSALGGLSIRFEPQSE